MGSKSVKIDSTKTLGGLPASQSRSTPAGENLELGPYCNTCKEDNNPFDSLPHQTTSNQKEEIKNYIANHIPTQELCESVSGSFEKVICYMLKDINEKQFGDLYNRYKRDAEVEHNVVKTMVEAFPLILNYNLVLLQWNSNQSKINLIYHWANRYNKDASPSLYVALIDKTFYPVLNKAIPVSIDDVFKMIDDKDSNSQSLLNLLTRLPQRDLNQIYPLPPQLSITSESKMSVVYFMCLLGRFDLMKAFQDYPLSIYEGAQEESVENTPLHIASFKGHLSIVVVLLSSGVLPIKNAEGRLPSDFDPKDISPSKRNTMRRIWKSYNAGKDTFMKEFTNSNPLHLDNYEPAILDSINDVFKMIDNEDSNSQSLLNLLTCLSQRDLNQIYPLPPQLSVTSESKMSVVYFMCLVGRVDLMKAFSIFPFSIYEGVQEESVENTPLHIASFKGHFSIVAVLLFSGVLPIKNAEGRLPSDFDPKDISPSQRNSMIRIWKFYNTGKDKFMKEFAKWNPIDVNRDKPEML